ncbi:MAG TPA: GerMN domain-containing protein [Candidatus Nanopelagicales bacterium]|nr:GerMN domain-containing protein [Candidatus Nanopelagicales bacterium]
MNRRLPASLRAVATALVALFALVALVALAGGCGGPAPTSAPPASPSPAAEVRVFFVPGGTDPCGTVAPVVRKVMGPVTAALALRELLAGPTPGEAAAGFTSLFGPATADILLDARFVDGIARVSFRDLRQILPSASSSCGSAALLAALDATLAQLPGIRGARYSFGGDEAAFYEWLQMAPPD